MTRRLLVTGAAVGMLWGLAALAQTPTVATYPSVVNPTTGATSYATAITPIVTTTSVSASVIKASPAAVYQVTAANLSSGAGFLALVNTTTYPPNGAITPLACVAIAANGSATINYAPGPPANFSTGVAAVLTTQASGCYSAALTLTGFISGLVQ